MADRDVTPEQGEATVTRLTTVPDLSGESRVPERFPPYRDPFLQLTGLSALCLAALLGSLLAEGIFAAALQAVVVASALLASVVLLRSVRHGWNVEAYGRARGALRRETTLRIERDALRDVSERFAALLEGEGDPKGGETLQCLVAEIHRVLSRSATETSVALAEETGGRFSVLCVAGYLRDKPFGIAPGKSCVADRPFAELLRTFAPEGKTMFEEINRHGRRYWVGIVGANPRVEIDAGLVRTLSAWVLIAAAMDQIPRSTQPMLRAS